MDMKTLRKRCAARIRDLLIPNPFDIQIFSSSVGESRGRPIVLQSISLHGVVSGAWAAMESIDIVFYEQHATPFHQQHIILHELSHILCEHQGFDFTEEGLRSLLLTDAPIERLRTLQSNHYSDEEEREAEMLASLILERVNNAQADNAIKDPNISGTLQWTQPYESPGILARSVASGYGKAMFCPHATRQRGIRATAEAVYLSQLRMLRAYRSLLHRVYEPPTVARWRGWKVRSPPCHS